ncbi:radical SAM protein [Paenibacillus sp. J2TS4]|uniref:SPL family radical SAM protein n=1 Tax=Paenibacillus sp. J2TS4 TaxID=2807194 RepID=UPI001AFE2E4B|nr:radical SAM protein [Paenibacillus sp. J2TS4]GIP34119.1 radical SAM protein [Paenibacillus sp. J2TS4]
MTRPIQYELMQAKTMLNPVKAPSMPFDWSLNPYRGCQHGCSFCYARSTHSFLGERADDAFQNHIYLKENAAEALERQLHSAARSRKGLKGLGSIAIGTATDPYQPIEGNARLTRQCLELLAKYRVPASITTRSPLILRDMDLLLKLPHVSVNLSVNTLNRTVWRKLEPSTPSPIKRLETVGQLVGAGIEAGIFMAPVLPYLTDAAEDLQELIETASQYRPRFMIPSYLRLSTAEVKVWFFGMLEQSFPELVRRYAQLYRYSGYAPSDYREEKMTEIKRLLAKYKLGTKQPVKRSEPEGIPNGPSSANEPVQLSFSFGN